MLADQRGLAVVLYNLGHVALHQGNVLQGTAYFGESLVQSQHLGDERGIADGLTGLAGALNDMERPAQAAMLFGAADALYADSVARLEYPDQIEYERNVAAVRAHLDAATFAQAWAEGRAMPQEYAVGYALALAPVPAEADADSDS
jgi:hypothetical protein